MMRTVIVMALGLGALAAGPLAPAARAETPRQVRLENHPVAAARAQVWRVNHPFPAGWPIIGAPGGGTVVWPGRAPLLPYLPYPNHLRQ